MSRGEALDELVHDVASQTASNAINSGQQIPFLLANGWDPEEIETHLREAMARVRYTLLPDAAPHTCWDQPGWDGTLQVLGACPGCDQAAEHPCQFCGYGAAFTTHNDLAHDENGDTNVPADPAGAWHNQPAPVRGGLT